MESNLHKQVSDSICKLYNIQGLKIQFQKTRKEFIGDVTIVVFPILSFSKKSPEKTADEIGKYLMKNIEYIINYNVIKGFLNITISNSYWLNLVNFAYKQERFGFNTPPDNSRRYLVEYSSPNTNKPIHLGHLRNNFLGYSISNIIKASGYDVKKVQIINDRGIHICKSMVSWIDHGKSETPENSGLKGDHLVGKYYVKFEEQYRKEVSDLISLGMTQDQAEKESSIYKKAQAMLIKWERGDQKVMEIWKMMNKWVLDGFKITYDRLGVDFDKNYFESDTYLLGKDIIQFGLEKGVFYQKDDGSVWIDLSEYDLDEKLVLRADGTSVYITQDIGTAIQRHKDFDFTHMIYTVANEQDYHFKVLFLILNKLGYQWAESCYHMSYGMVELPSGKMKSREGTVVDADDFMQQMVDNAREIAGQLGKIGELTHKKQEELYEIVGLGALKYFLLKVDPKKNMLFDPVASIDFNGNTAPFIQYAYARIQSLKNKHKGNRVIVNSLDILSQEKDLIKLILDFPNVINESAKSSNPSLVANYIYNLVKEYNSYYQTVNILSVNDDCIVSFRVALSDMIGKVIKDGMSLLGIDVPDRM